MVLVFLSNQFVRYLGQAATGQLAGNILAEVTALAIPHLLGLLLPLAFYLSLLLALGRMYSDSEITVMQACGFSQTKILKAVLLVATMIFTVVTILNLWLTPLMLYKRDKLLTNIGLASVIQTLLPGRFQAGPDGKFVFYLAGLSRDRQTMRDLFMAEQVKVKDNTTQKEHQVWSVLTAQSGYQKNDSDKGVSYIVAKNGNRYYGRQGQSDYRVVHFEEYGVRVKQAAPVLKSRDEATLSTTKLWALSSPDRPRLSAELQWRFSMPISVFLLALIAVPLARVRPRKGRYTRILPGILVCVVYANCLFVSRAWVQKGMVSTSFGMWWVQGLLALLALMLWFPYWRHSKR